MYQDHELMEGAPTPQTTVSLPLESFMKNTLKIKKIKFNEFWNRNANVKFDEFW